VKVKLFLLAVFLGLKIQAQVYTQITNPVPQVTCIWDTQSGVTWNLYYGIASRTYTNRTPTVTNQVLVTLPARGVKYFFAATAVQGTLQSQFSNEVTYTPTNPPASPNMHTPLTLVVQYKEDLLDPVWADSGMAWPLWPSETNRWFRLELTEAAQDPQPAVIRLSPGMLTGRHR